MSKWGKCEAEGRDHELKDFTSRQIVDSKGNIHNITSCRWCSKRPAELMK